MRDRAFTQPPHPRLWARSRQFCPGGRTERREWCARSWWGIAAGELVRRYLYDPDARDEAMRLLVAPDWSGVDQALEEQGVILAAAHIGPPKYAMNVILDRFPEPAIVTNTGDMPVWMTERAGIFLDPRDPETRSQVLLKGAMQLRKGGVFYAAVDGKRAEDKLTIERFGRTWQFSPGVPALARMLNVKSFVLLALWEGNRIVLQSFPIQAPDPSLPAEEYQREWIMAYWDVISPVFETSPENLRFLAPPFRKEFNA